MCTLNKHTVECTLNTLFFIECTFNIKKDTVKNISAIYLLQRPCRAAHIYQRSLQTAHSAIISIFVSGWTNNSICRSSTSKSYAHDPKQAKIQILKPSCDYFCGIKAAKICVAALVGSTHILCDLQVAHFFVYWVYNMSKVSLLLLEDWSSCAPSIDNKTYWSVIYDSPYDKASDEIPTLNF